MLTKTKIAVAAALVLGSASVALAQDADPNLLNRYPAYNGAVAGVSQTQRTFQSAPVALRRGGEMRTAPVRLQGRESFNAPTQGAGHLPRAFIEQEQPGFPQSPPGF
jgi:hypothetical protein